MSDAFLPGNGFDTYETQDKVLVSMDGTVDCGVAVRILQQQGFGVAGAVVQLAADQSAWAAAARQAAEALGIECIVLKAEALADQPAEVLGAPRKGLRFVFSGDSAPCPALEQAAQGADLLLCDATYALPEQQEQAAQWGHSTFGQSASLAAQARAKRLWLTHYSPMITDPEEYAAQAQSIFPAAECGFDGKQIILQYDEEAT